MIFIQVDINSESFLVKSNLSILEACKYLGITNIPRFCYHESLSVAGNCRMCLVEVENSPKPVASCAAPLLNKMKIFSNSPLVKKARENILEALLIQHPLDCPICDQGGECDLQDQAKNFGGGYSKYFFFKRGVENKYCGPLIKTIMTRCIHCTRCVRFSSEIAGSDFFGTLNRGGSTEIGGYFSNSGFISEISGNVIDLCPVGALTSKPYAFKARPWELKITEGVDLTDGFGSSIYINSKESEIVRIVPKINVSLNESIISDKARFYFDSQTSQRLSAVLTNDHYEDNKNYVHQTWISLLDNINIVLKKKVLFLINEDIDLKTLSTLKYLSNNHNIKIKSISKKYDSFNFFFSWLTNKILDLEKKSTFCLLLSVNVKTECVLLNSRLRQKFLNQDFSIYSFNQNFNSNFPIKFLSLSTYSILNFLNSRGNDILNLFVLFKNPIICIGYSLYNRGFNILSLKKALYFLNSSVTIYPIALNSNTKGNEFLNFNTFNTKNFKEADFIFSLNLDTTIDSAKSIETNSKSNVKTFWFNSHGSSICFKSNTIIPVLGDFEDKNIFFNLEERSQKTLKVLEPIGMSRSLRSIFNLFISLKEIPSFLNFSNEIVLKPKLFLSNKFFFKNLNYSNSFLTWNICYLNFYPFKSIIEDFYLSNKYSKQSKAMLECSKKYRDSLIYNFPN